jgi:probable addiction module antidote protein
VTEIAKEAGLSRSSLYKALSPDGNPEFATVASAGHASGVCRVAALRRFSATPTT